jgi:hypothetical protein
VVAQVTEADELQPGAAEQSPAVSEGQPTRRIWLVVAWVLVGAVIAGTGLVAALGTGGALIAAGCIAGVVVLAAIVWRLPHLRRHFASPRRTRSSQLRTRRMSLGGRAAGRRGGLGRLLPGGRKGGAGRGGSGRKTGAGLLGRTRAGKALAGSKAGRAAGRARRALGGGRGRAAGSGGAARRGRLRRAAAALVPGPARRAAARRRARRAQDTKDAKDGKPARRRRLRRLVARVRRRGKDAKPAAPDQAEAAGKPDGKPADGLPARQPGAPVTPGTPDNRKTTAIKARRHAVTQQVLAAAEAIEEHIGGFEPENMNDFGEFLRQLPQIYQALASGLATIADRFGGEYPINPAVVDHLHEMASGAAGQQEYAGEAHQLFATTHAEEIERLENPRPNEQLWDVAENQ